MYLEIDKITTTKVELECFKSWEDLMKYAQNSSPDTRLFIKFQDENDRTVADFEVLPSKNKVMITSELYIKNKELRIKRGGPDYKKILEEKIAKIGPNDVLTVELYKNIEPTPTDFFNYYSSRGYKEAIKAYYYILDLINKKEYPKLKLSEQDKNII